MTAPAPSPAEQAVIDRSGIFAEERVIEEVARALWDELPDSGYGRKPWADLSKTTHFLYRSMAAAAVAAYRAQDGGACGDLSPGFNFGGDRDVDRLMCELPFGHGGAHQHDNGDGLSPTRWIATQDGGAEEAVRRVESAPGIARAAWAEGYEACRRGQQKHNPYRAALAPQAGDGAR